MNLVTRFLAARRDKLLMKLGCWLVIFSLVLGLMLPQQRAEALVAELTIGSVAALAASYLCACGLPLVTQGMDRDALVSNVQRLIQEFLDTELGGITIQDWLVGVWDLVFTGGKLVLSRMLTDKLMEFAQWVAEKYATQVGVHQIYAQSGFTAADGTYYEFGHYDKIDRLNSRLGTNIFGSTAILPGASVSILLTSDIDLTISVESMDTIWDFFIFSSSSPDVSIGMNYSANQKEAGWYCSNLCFVPYDLNGDTYLCFMRYWPQCLNDSFYKTRTFSAEANILGRSIKLSKLNLSESDLSIDRAPSMSYIPEGIEAEQGIALDVGAAATMDLDMVLQGVLDDVLAGELTATMEAAGEAVVDPPAEEITDVDNLGLPALGEALTSRFPFSIPWDFFRAIKLLAAPAKAPYFEVDFMEPLADDVGGWQGDTTVILDFSEYAIIGQISRWTSTIGFCLMLASGTKRLIWTA